MRIWQIVSPHQHNRYIWLSALTLLALLIAGIADPFALVMAYFLETLLIGLIHCFKMYFVSRNSASQKSNPGKDPAYLIGFFIVHYSFFVAVQSIFVFAIFQLADPNISEPFNLIANYRYVLSLKGIGYGLLTMLVFLGIQTYFSFYRTKVYNLYTVDNLFFQPYLRIFIQQFVVIMSIFFIFIFPSGIMAAVLLIILRLFVDLVGVFVHSSERNKRRLAAYLAKRSDGTEEEIYEELNKMF